MKKMISAIALMLTVALMLSMTAFAQGEHQHDGVAFTVWSDSASMPTAAGSYCLETDVTFTSSWIVPDGTVNLCLNGHTIKYNNPDALGSVIEVSAKSVFNLYDCKGRGVITGGSGHLSNDNTFGGGIYGYTGSVVNIYQGIIKNNSATMSGGGIYSNGTLNIYGGTITENSAVWGGGVYSAGTLNIQSGTIAKNSATHGGGVCSKAVLNIYGGLITENNADNGGGVCINANGAATIENGTISKNKAENGGGVYAKGELTFNNGVVADNTANHGGGIYVAHTAAINGGTISGNSTTNTTGYADGHGAGVYVDTEANLTYTNGTITGNTAAARGGGIYVYGVLNMQGGTISKNEAAWEGGGIYEAAVGQITISDGLITENYTETNGGAVFATNMTVTGGVFTKNRGEYSGGVCCYNGIVTVTGGEFTNNAAVENINGHDFGGMNDTYYDVISGVFTVLPPKINEASMIYKVGGLYNVIVQGTQPTKSDYKFVGFYDNEQLTGMPVTEYNNTTVYYPRWIDIHNDHNDIAFTPWNNIASMPTEAGSYYLETDVTLTSSWQTPDGTVNLCLNGYTVKYDNPDAAGSVITVGENTVFNLYDCGESGVITGGSGLLSNDKTFGGGIYGRTGSVINIYQGIIKGNSVMTSGGGIYTNGTLNIYGGTITENSAELGGGVYENGTVNIYGGTITKNSAVWGGGVSADEEFNMYGGLITENTADHGGGVYVTGGYTSIENGTISKNKAEYGGGLAESSAGKLTVTGGLITENTAKTSGGGVYARTALITGGVISNNSGRYGGGVYVDGPVTVTGGEITYNITENADYSDAYDENDSLDVTGGVFTVLPPAINEASMKYKEGDLYYVVAQGTQLKKEGYAFVGFYDNEALTGAPLTSFNSVDIYYPSWSAILFVTSADSGFYGETSDAPQSGAIVFNTYYNGIEDNHANVTAFGTFVYISGGNRVKLEASTVEELVRTAGKFYSTVTDIPVEYFDSYVYAKPYVIINGEVVYGETVSSNVNVNKWLGVGDITQE